MHDDALLSKLPLLRHGTVETSGAVPVINYLRSQVRNSNVPGVVCFACLCLYWPLMMTGLGAIQCSTSHTYDKLDAWPSVDLTVLRDYAVWRRGIAVSVMHEVKPNAGYMNKCCCKVLFFCFIILPKPRLRVGYWAFDLKPIGQAKSKVRIIGAVRILTCKLPWGTLNSEQVYGWFADCGSPWNNTRCKHFGLTDKTAKMYEIGRQHKALSNTRLPRWDCILTWADGLRASMT